VISAMWTLLLPIFRTKNTLYRTNPNPRSPSTVKKSAPAIAPRRDLMNV